MKQDSKVSRSGIVATKRQNQTIRLPLFLRFGPVLRFPFVEERESGILDPEQLSRFSAFSGLTSGEQNTCSANRWTGKQLITIVRRVQCVVNILLHFPLFISRSYSTKDNGHTGQDKQEGL